MGSIQKARQTLVRTPVGSTDIELNIEPIIKKLLKDERLPELLEEHGLSREQVANGEFWHTSLSDQIWDEIYENTVFCVGWDGSFPGTSGAHWIQEWKGLYFFTSSDIDPLGPFESLADALECEYLGGSYFSELSSSEMSTQELVELAMRWDSEQTNDLIDINGELFIWMDGKLALNER